MTISAKVYQPDVRVTLYKTIQRTTLDGTNRVAQRFTALANKIDLTPYLGDGAGLRTSKSIRDGAGGWSVTLLDKAYASLDTLESTYGIFEPMDFIEIRARHDPPDLIGNVISSGNDQDPTRPPIIMRGFISAIQRTEVMSPDGHPQRSVTISGQDYGKLWQQLQILFMPGYVLGEGLLTNFKLAERFGIGLTNSLSASDFITQIITQIINPYILALMPQNSPNPTAIKLDITVKNGQTSVGGIQNQEGSIFDLLRGYSDVGIWNELYLEDREDGVYCVFRPNPFRDVTGKAIQPDAPVPTTVTIQASDVIQLSVSRSDANVANFYWVRSPRFELVSEVQRQLYALTSSTANVSLDSYENSASKLYGVRPMYGDTQMGGDDTTVFSSGQPQAAQSTRDTGVASWIDNRRSIMVAQNKDNVLFESGSMRVRGNPLVKPGCYVTLVRGAFQASYYVVAVDHDYTPFSGFFSTLTLERGTGFIERVKRGAQASPYLAEMIQTNL